MSAAPRKPVSISVDYSRFENVVHRGLHVLNRLRDAKVPVVGILWPESVESGVLTVGEPDMISGEVTWTWQP